MKNQSPKNIIKASIDSIKDFIDNELNNQNEYFDDKLVIQLKNETQSLLNICNQLNQDTEFITLLNNSIKNQQPNGLLYKTQHFMLSDLATLYQQNTSAESEKSLFVLAYYYDVLRNNEFASEKGLQTLNKLVATTEFKTNIKKLAQSSVFLGKKSQNNLVLNALHQLKNPNTDVVKNHISQFLQLTFQFNPTEIAAITQQNTTSEEPENPLISLPPENDTLEKVMQELNELIGMHNIKSNVTELVNLLEIQTKRKTKNLKNIDIALHTVFLGPPGTGKTTVARLLSRIFKHLGFLSKGQMYETDREGLVAGFVGQTATKTDKVVTDSLGGVLFIDEAYALTPNSFGNDYGAEAVNTLLKRMEDNRDDLAVVVAGYNEPMENFINSNPGLRSRFNRYFHFDHFKPEELFLIFEQFCKKSDFILTQDAIDKVKDSFELLYEKKSDSFGNARVVRNLFEKCVQLQANRIVKLPKITTEVLKTLTDEDIPEMAYLEAQFLPKPEKPENE